MSWSTQSLEILLTWNLFSSQVIAKDNLCSVSSMESWVEGNLVLK